MQKFPLLSRFQYDCHVKVVETEANETVSQLADSCAYHSVGVHVKNQPGKILRVRRTTDTDDEPPLNGDITVGEAGLVMYDCIDVYFSDPES